MPWNFVTVIVSWLVIVALLAIPTLVGLFLLHVTGFLLGVILGGIFLFLASDSIAKFIRAGYPKTS
jgi:hypothetical protein